MEIPRPYFCQAFFCLAYKKLQRATTSVGLMHLSILITHDVLILKDSPLPLLGLPQCQNNEALDEEHDEGDTQRPEDDILDDGHAPHRQQRVKQEHQARDDTFERVEELVTPVAATRVRFSRNM